MYKHICQILCELNVQLTSVPFFLGKGDEIVGYGIKTKIHSFITAVADFDLL